MNWLGSKGGNGVWQRILSEMPAHTRYVEPFCGSAVIARMKIPAEETWLMDLDPSAPGLAMLTASSPNLTTVVVGDAVQHLRAWRGEMGRETLVYCDPPYLRSVRGRHRYRHEFDTDEQHSELMRVLLELNSHVMISGYRSDLYDRTLAGWRRVDIPTVNRAGKRVTECLWLNFPASVARHDARHQGDSFRERERIKRKAARWQRKFLAMTDGERAAVLAALSEPAP